MYQLFKKILPFLKNTFLGINGSTRQEIGEIVIYTVYIADNPDYETNIVDEITEPLYLVDG